MTLFHDFDINVSRNSTGYIVQSSQTQLTVAVTQEQARDLLQTSTENVKQDRSTIGHEVFKYFVTNDLFNIAREAAGSEKGLRILVKLLNCPELTALPWELLHDGETFIALREDTAIVRFLAPQKSLRPLLIPTLPVRVLLTSYLSDKSNLVIREQEEFLKGIEADSEGVIEVTCLRQATRTGAYQKIVDAARGKKPFHIWHHVGHVGMVNNHVAVQFNGDWMDIATLMNLIQQSEELRIITLNVQYTQTNNQKEILADFSRVDVPMLVMPIRTISDFGRNSLFRTFYRHLFTDGAMKAIQLSRKQMALVDSGNIEWADVAHIQHDVHDRILQPHVPFPHVPSSIQREQVFISYSHQDQVWLDRLLRYLEPLKQYNAIKIWSDKDIGAGKKWFDEIRMALRIAKVAVILGSPAFFSSKFIAEHELPEILEAEKRRELTIIWLAVSKFMYERTPLGPYQASNNLQYPLDRVSEPEAEDMLLKAANEILKALES